MIGLAPSCLSNFPSRTQTCLALQILRSTTGHSSSVLCSTRPRYLKASTPSQHFYLLSPVRLKVAPLKFDSFSTSLLHHLICVLLSHCAVWRCLMTRTAGMCIPHMLQRGRSSITSWITAICDRKCLNIKCSLSLPTLRVSF